MKNKKKQTKKGQSANQNRIYTTTMVIRNELTETIENNTYMKNQEDMEKGNKRNQKRKSKITVRDENNE